MTQEQAQNAFIREKKWMITSEIMRDDALG
jgi:hypothetical protein